jgi:hypothetical protein
MAHRVSAPALTAAREVLKEYALEVCPETAAAGMTASEAHVAIVIDLATNVFKIAELRQEHYYWQQRLNAKTAEAAPLATYLKKVMETFATVPQYKHDEQPVRVTWQLPPGVVGMMPPSSLLTKASREAARYLQHYYRVMPLDGHLLMPIDTIRIAMRVEAGLGLAEAFEAVPLVQLCLDRLKNNQATRKEIRYCFRNLGVLLESLPNYADRREETMLLT